MAEWTVGMLYFYGHFVPQDYVEAVRWLRKAAEQDLSGAQVWLGRMYLNGKGVLRDYVEAARWFMKSAMQNNAEGQALLSLMYFEGKGVTRDLVQAYMWVNLAAAKGDPKYEKTREVLAQAMTPSQIDEAQRLTREWKPGSHILFSGPGRTGPGEAKGAIVSSKAHLVSPIKWLVLLGSDRLEDRAKSEERLALIKPHAPNARIVNSGTYPKLRAGWWVVVEGPFDKATAEREKARLLPTVSDAFLRAGW